MMYAHKLHKITLVYNVQKAMGLTPGGDVDLGWNYVISYKLTYIFMLHVFEVAELPVCPEGVDCRLKRTGKLLQSHTDVVLYIHS